MVTYPQVSSPKPCMRLSSPPYVQHAPPISFFSILSPEQYWVRITTEQRVAPYSKSRNKKEIKNENSHCESLVGHT
jgi:hypothetical protein